MQISIQGDPARQFRRRLELAAKSIDEAIVRTARKTAAELKTEIFKDIQASGNFGKPWRSAIGDSRRDGHSAR